MTTNTAVIGSPAEPMRLTFAETIKSSLRNWRQFSGRASRREYWSFALFSVLAPVAILVIGGIVAAAVSAVSPNATDAVSTVGALLVFGVFVLLLVPLLSVAVRRLHDSGHSAWLYLVALVPYVGGFILLYFLVKPSQDGENKYGLHPYRLG